MIEWTNPPSLPQLTLPQAPTLPTPILEVPRGQVPTYKPLVVPPSDLRPPPGVKGGVNDEPPKVKTQSIKPPDLRQVQIPFTEQQVPLPSNDILITAGTTATVSVAATLTATSVFKWTVNAMKPILKQLWTRITKRKGSLNSLSSSGPPDS